MKILGEKSLSSKVIVGLKVLFTIISIVDLLVIETIVKVIIELIGMENVEKSVASLILFIMIITTGIIALFIIYQFIKIFGQLEKENIFSKAIEKRFLISAVSSIIIGIIYFINTLLIPSEIVGLEVTEIIVYVFFSVITAVIFLMFGIGLMILREIYKTAIENKEENDLTI